MKRDALEHFNALIALVIRLLVLILRQQPFSHFGSATTDRQLSNPHYDVGGQFVRGRLTWFAHFLAAASRTGFFNYP